MLIVFDDMISDTKANKKMSPIVTELFLRRWKLIILNVFISQSYFKVPKTIRLNATYSFIMKTLSEGELQQITSNHSLYIEFKDYMKFCKDYN